MTYKDIGKVEYLPFAESVDLMKNRQLNATLQSAGLGVASLKDLSTSTEITVVAVPKEIVDKIGPPFVSVMIPANTYTGQDKDVPTAAVINYLVTSSAVSDDLAYQMTKLIFESLPELANAHVAGKEIKLRDRRHRQPGAAASRRDPLLQGKGPDQVRPTLCRRHARAKARSASSRWRPGHPRFWSGALRRGWPGQARP